MRSKKKSLQEKVAGDSPEDQIAGRKFHHATP